MFSYNEAADKGHSLACFNLGVLHENGQGVHKNIGKAIQYYTKAANMGDVDAQLRLGMIYDRKIDYYEAFCWYIKAGEKLKFKSDLWLRIGEMYENGIGTSQSYQEANNYYLPIAMVRNSKAQVAVGKLYLQGLGTNKDIEAALDWFEKASHSGNKEAQSYIDDIKKQREEYNLVNIPSEQIKFFDLPLAVQSSTSDATHLSKQTKFFYLPPT